MALRLLVLTEPLSICRLAAAAEVPPWATAGSLWSVTRTPQELSIVCETARVPAGVHHEAGWRALMVEGPLAFSEVGVLAGLAAPLAREGIAIFVISTFDTDYLLLKAGSLALARRCLQGAGYQLMSL